MIGGNLRCIVKATHNPFIYRTLLYFLLCGITVPSFGDVGYYFTLNVLKFSKFTFSLLSLLGYVTLFLGTLLYNKYFKDYEIRSLL